MPNVTVSCESPIAFDIELERVNGGEKIAAGMDRDANGYHLFENTRFRPASECMVWRIGKRKHWQSALAEALTLLENELSRRCAPFANPGFIPPDLAKTGDGTRNEGGE